MSEMPIGLHSVCIKRLTILLVSLFRDTDVSLFFERTTARIIAAAALFYADVDRFGAALAFAIVLTIFGFAIDERAVTNAFAERHSGMFAYKAVTACSLGGMRIVASDLYIFETTAVFFVVRALTNRTIYIRHKIISLSVFRVSDFAVKILYPKSV